MGRLIGYVRVSTGEQDLQRQLDALNKAGCAESFRDKASGARGSRPGLDACVKALEPGDTHTLPLPATHVRLATGLHTDRDSLEGITQKMRLSGRNHAFWHSSNRVSSFRFTASIPSMTDRPAPLW